MRRHVHLHPDRYTQLEHYAASLGITMAEAVAVMLNHEIEAGRLGQGLPGIVVQRGDDLVKLSIEPVFTQTVSIGNAARIAEFLEHAAKPGLKKVVADHETGLVFTRQGRGVIVSDPAGVNSRSFTPSLVRDLARLIRNAVD